MQKTKYNLKQEENPSDEEEKNGFIIKEYHVPKEDSSIYTDVRTKVKTVAIPIQFPTGVNGMIGITHLDNRPWFPSEDIEAIIIVFKPV